MMMKTLFMSLFFATLALGAAGARDTVLTSPMEPTAADSITFSLFNADICCCATYGNLSVEATDSTVILAYAYEDEQCALCMCLMAGSTVQFKHPPLKAGTYRIYKLQDSCRLGAQVCVAMMAMPEYVGTVTVQGTTGNSAPVRMHSETLVGRGTPSGVVDMRGRAVPSRAVMGSGVRITDDSRHADVRIKAVD